MSIDKKSSSNNNIKTQEDNHHRGPGQTERCSFPSGTGRSLVDLCSCGEIKVWLVGKRYL